MTLSHISTQRKLAPLFWILLINTCIEALSIQRLIQGKNFLPLFPPPLMHLFPSNIFPSLVLFFSFSLPPFPLCFILFLIFQRRQCLDQMSGCECEIITTDSCTEGNHNHSKPNHLTPEWELSNKGRTQTDEEEIR